MNTAEKIYQEVQQLPEAEVLQRKAALLACFSRFQLDLSGFKFDREEANARR